MKKRRLCYLTATIMVLIVAAFLIIYGIFETSNDYVKLRTEVIFVLLFIILIIASVLFLRDYFYTFSIEKSIDNLTNLSTKISKGQYEERIDLFRNNKIYKLGEAFNSMADRLQNTIMDLDDKKIKCIQY